MLYPTYTNQYHREPRLPEEQQCNGQVLAIGENSGLIVAVCSRCKAVGYLIPDHVSEADPDPLPGICPTCGDGPVILAIDGLEDCPGDCSRQQVSVLELIKFLKTEVGLPRPASGILLHIKNPKLLQVFKEVVEEAWPNNMEPGFWLIRRGVLEIIAAVFGPVPADAGDQRNDLALQRAIEYLQLAEFIFAHALDVLEPAHEELGREAGQESET